MFSNRKTPLAWHNLTHSWRRLLVAVGGLGFAVLLVFMQNGFRYALFDSAVRLIRELDADLVIVSSAHRGLVSLETFDETRVYQARGCPGVAGVYPFYLFYGGEWKLAGEISQRIRLLACDPAAPVFPPNSKIQGQLPLLSEPGTALFDGQGKLKKYGVRLLPNGQLDHSSAEVGGKNVEVVGSFALGTDFVSDGTLIVSDRTLAKCYPARSPGRPALAAVDLGVVQLEPGADAAAARDRLAALLPGDVKVRTKAEFLDDEREFWNRSTPIGYIFFLGMGLGFVVGVIICYQVIGTDVADHLAEFATLKAMGYRNAFFIGFIFQESLYLTVLGFLPGMAASWGLYQALEWLTGLPLDLTPGRAAAVFGFTALMCVLSGCLVIRKVFDADPAELY